MKASKAQKVARNVAAGWWDTTGGLLDLQRAIADAIEKAVKAERRACAKAADDVAYESTDIDDAAERAANACGERIRARSRS